MRSTGCLRAALRDQGYSEGRTTGAILLYGLGDEGRASESKMGAEAYQLYPGEIATYRISQNSVRDCGTALDNNSHAKTSARQKALLKDKPLGPTSTYSSFSDVASTASRMAPSAKPPAPPKSRREIAKLAQRAAETSQAANTRSDKHKYAASQTLLNR